MLLPPLSNTALARMLLPELPSTSTPSPPLPSGRVALQVRAEEIALDQVVADAGIEDAAGGVVVGVFAVVVGAQ